MKPIVQMPTSRFTKVLCKKCKNEQIAFTKASTVIKCLNCEEELVVPTGGVSIIKGKKLMTLT